MIIGIIFYFFVCLRVELALWPSWLLQAEYAHLKKKGNKLKINIKKGE